MFEAVYTGDDGRVFLFGPSGSNHFMMSDWTGLSVELETAQGYLQIGETLQNATIKGRSIDVTGEMYGEVAERKDALRSACHPLARGTLKINNAYSIRVVVAEAPSFSPHKWSGLFKMQFYAPFPFFRTKEERAELGTIRKQFRLPINYSTPHRFGTREHAAYKNVRNMGDVHVPFAVEIRCIGISDNPILRNLKNGKTIKINQSLFAGDIIRIWRDEQNILQAELESYGETTDIINSIDEESNLEVLEIGDNLLQATDDEGGAGLTVAITYAPGVATIYEH